MGDVKTLTFLETVNAWGFPLYPDETVVLGGETDVYVELVEFVAENSEFLRQPGAWLGTWCHPKTGYIYLDITTSLPKLGDALKAARAINSRSTRKIEAIYNSSLGETLFLTSLSSANGDL